MAAKNARLKRKCRDKQSFPTQDEAWRRAVSINRSGKAQPLKAYKCQICKQWHLARIHRTL